MNACARSSPSCGRRPRHVGGPAPARARRQEREDGRSVAPPRGRPLGERRRHGDRRQAHHLPEDGGRRRRRGGRHAGTRVTAAGRKRSQHEAPCACAGPTAPIALRAPGAAARLGTSDAVLEHLVGRYGGDARTLLAMVRAQPELGEPLVPTLPYLKAEALYAVRYEMATTVDDVLGPAHARPAPRARRVRRRRPRRGAAARTRAGLERRRGREAQAEAYRAAVAGERGGERTAGDAPSSRWSGPEPCHAEPGAPTPPIALRAPDPSRCAATSTRPCVDVDDDAARRACAASATT